MLTIAHAFYHIFHRSESVLAISYFLVYLVHFFACQIVIYLDLQNSDSIIKSIVCRVCNFSKISREIFLAFFNKYFLLVIKFGERSEPKKICAFLSFSKKISKKVQKKIGKMFLFFGKMFFSWKNVFIC